MSFQSSLPFEHIVSLKQIVRRATGFFAVRFQINIFISIWCMLEKHVIWGQLLLFKIVYKPYLTRMRTPVLSGSYRDLPENLNQVFEWNLNLTACSVCPTDVVCITTTACLPGWTLVSMCSDQLWFQSADGQLIQQAIDPACFGPVRLS